MTLPLNAYDLTVLRDLADLASLRGNDVPVSPSALRFLLDAVEDAEAQRDEAVYAALERSDLHIRDLEEELTKSDEISQEKTDRIRELEDHIAAITSFNGGES